MIPHARDVLLDLTALDTISRYRGIGRYVASLATGIAGLQSSQICGLRIGGLIRHRFGRGPAVDPTLTWRGTPTRVPTKRHYDRYLIERRLMLGSVLASARPALAHLPEARATPWDRRVPYVVTCHDLIPLVLWRDYLLRVPGARTVRRAQEWVRYHAAARVISVSEATKLDLVRELRLDPARIDVVHHGVDHQRFHANVSDAETSAVRARFNTTRPFVLYVGAGDRRKNLDVLITAFARTRAKRDLDLVLAGRLTNKARSRLDALAREVGAGPSVRFLDHVDEEWLAPLYRACLLHVFPSSYEGFGLPILEAMACGAPTVCLAGNAAINEVAGSAAAFVPAMTAATTADAMADVIDSLVGDTRLRDDLRSRGLRRASVFTWARAAAETVACYVKALDGLRRRSPATSGSGRTALA